VSVISLGSFDSVLQLSHQIYQMASSLPMLPPFSRIPYNIAQNVYIVPEVLLVKIFELLAGITARALEHEHEYKTLFWR